MKRWIILWLAGCGGNGGGEGEGEDGGAPDAGPPDDGPASDLGQPPEPFCLDAIPPDDTPDPACPNPVPDEPDRLDEALALVDLDRCTLVYTEDEWSLFPDYLREDDFRLPFYNAVHDAPLRAPPWARAVSQRLDAAAGGTTPVASAIHLAADRLGRAVETCEVLPTATSLADALRALGADGDLDAAVAGVPADLAAALVPVVEAVAAAAAARDEAVAAYGGDLAGLYEEAPTLILRHPDGAQMDPTDEATWTFLSQGMDYAKLYAAAASLALTVERADLARFAGAEGFDVDVETPLGRVILADAAAHVHEDESFRDPIALLLDSGGDDTYLVPAGATTRHDAPVAVAVDLAGADEYAYEEDPDSDDEGRLVSDEWGRFSGSSFDGPTSRSITERQGAARLGVGLLFDYGAGDDRYRSLRMSQGFGALGVGALYDEGGDDTYAAETASQGSALLGIGLLIDAAGDDEQRAWSMSQGFGYVYGLGALWDGDGTDAHLCDAGDPDLGGDPLYYTPQLPGQGNSSFCQGAGFGRRDDFSGAYMSGGIGVMRDAAGDDRYEASVFAQGTGYWFGTGVLDDEGGDDTYDGLWYVQGSDAHFALDVFRDGGGNDVYNGDFPPAATSIGVGHDFSVSFHLDEGGDDMYTAPGLSLGAGNVNGFGFLFNLGGVDSYATPGGATLGAGNLSCEVSCAEGCGCVAARRDVKTVGVFIDLDGGDTYVVGGVEEDRDDMSAVNNLDPDPATSGEHGAFLDAASGEVVLP